MTSLLARFKFDVGKVLGDAIRFIIACGTACLSLGYHMAFYKYVLETKILGGGEKRGGFPRLSQGWNLNRNHWMCRKTAKVPLHRDDDSLFRVNSQEKRRNSVPNRRLVKFLPLFSVGVPLSSLQRKEQVFRGDFYPSC